MQERADLTVQTPATMFPICSNWNGANCPLQYRRKSDLAIVQTLPGKFVEGETTCVDISQHQVVDILYLTETEIHSISVGKMALVQFEK